MHHKTMKPQPRFALVAGCALLTVTACVTGRTLDLSPTTQDASLGSTRSPLDHAAERTPADNLASLDANADAGADTSTRSVRVQLDPDGNDDIVPEPPTRTPLFEHASLVSLGAPPLGLTRICDLRAFGGKLYAAHANQPLGTDGATITTYSPEDPKKPFSVAFDWNRFGEPTKGGGGGQGFLRVHAIDGRLYVPDADPPYGGLGMVDHGTEGYVFVSDKLGAFARARYPHAMLPGLPDQDGRAGAAILPRAYHVIDVVKLRGHLYASTGSVPPDARAWSGPSPGALHMANPQLSRFTYALGYPSPYPGGVWRLTSMVRYRDKLYSGLQDYDGKSPWDYVVLTLPEGRDVLKEGDGVGKRVTDRGAAFTLRWYADRGDLYWIAGNYYGNVSLRRTRDGETWDTIDLPAAMGRPTDIVRFRGHLVVMTEQGLVALDDDGKVTGTLATVTAKKTPFVIDDTFCAAPLGVLGDTLYVGGQRGGVLYRFDETPSMPVPKPADAAP